MKAEYVYKIRKTDGSTENMTYNDLCHRLGFIPEVHFVRVTTAGTVSFWCGKPDEIRSLKRACTDCNIRMSYALDRYKR